VGIVIGIVQYDVPKNEHFQYYISLLANAGR